MKILIVCIVLIIGVLGLIVMLGFNRSSMDVPDRIKNISNMRSVQTALLSHHFHNNEQYPNSLQELVPEELDDEVKWLDKKHFELIGVDLHYVPNLNTKDGEKIILYTTADKNGKAIVGYVDCRVMTINPEELNHLLIKLGLSPIEIIAKTP